MYIVTFMVASLFSFVQVVYPQVIDVYIIIHTLYNFVPANMVFYMFCNNVLEYFLRVEQLIELVVFGLISVLNVNL